MKTTNQLLALIPALAFSSCASHNAAKPAGPVNLTIQEQWVGDFPVAALNLLSSDQGRNARGYIADARTFAAVWNAFKPGEAVPTVDFKKNLVVFTRNTDFFNRTRIVTVKLTDGVAELMAMETMSARPIEDKLALAMAVIPRNGVRFIANGAQRIPVPGT